MRITLGRATVVLVILAAAGAIVASSLEIAFGLRTVGVVPGALIRVPSLTIEWSGGALMALGGLIAFLLWLAVFAAIGVTLQGVSRRANETGRRLEHAAGLRRRYKDGELDAMEYDRIDRDRAA